MNYFTIYKISINKALKRVSTYICMLVVLVCSLLTYILIPFVLGFGHIKNYYASSEWSTLCIEISFITTVLSSAFIGETNAINDEKIYFLSKDIKKSTFIFAKCMSSFTIAFLMTLISSLILLVIYGIGITQWDNNIFKLKHGVNAASIFGSFLVLTIFGSMIATIWKYQTRSSVNIFICGGLLAIYCYCFLLLTKNLQESDLDDELRFWWLTSPILIFIPLTVILGSIGFAIFMRKETD